MNTQITPETTPQVVDLLESTEADLAQYRKELGDEQVSVVDRYEQLKKELQAAIGQMKVMIRDNKALAHEVSEALHQRLAAIDILLQAHAPRLTRAELEEQLSRIRKSMEDLVAYLGSLSFYDFSLANIQDIVYRFRIKLAILKLKFQLGALQMKENVLEARYDFKKKFFNIKSRFSQSEEAVENRWNLFRHEIVEAYEHLQKAFTAK